MRPMPAPQGRNRSEAFAPADYEQLAHLIWADVVVSDRQAFFRSAFDTLWKPRGKRMESAASFIELLEAAIRALTLVVCKPPTVRAEFKPSHCKVPITISL